MKILMIAPTPFFADRGCHVRIYEETRALQKLGCEVTICTYHNGRDISNLDIRRIMNIPWYKKLEAGPSFHMMYLDLLLFFKSFMTALKIKPDIIHGHLHEGAFIGFFVAKIVRKPLLFDCQGSLTGEMRSHKFLKNNRLFYWLTRFIEKRIDNMANGVITSSTAVAKELEKLFNVSKERVFPTLDGVDTDNFSPDSDVAELKIKLNLPQDKNILVYLGLLNEYQGVDCLLQSIPLVLKETYDVHFLIMGYPNVGKYRSMAEQLGISSNVTFTGRLDYREAPRYLSLGNIAIAPKISETEANGKIYNYMACGLPIVAFDTTPSREILGDLGIYAKPKDYHSLANSMVEILRDEELREELSRKVRKKAVRDYSWNKVGERIVKVYEGLMTDARQDILR
jgi:glycosyltransferase involved in cell wall biosynthesis